MCDFTIHDKKKWCKQIRVTFNFSSIWELIN